MKKIISAILLFALAACTLAACGGEPATETEKTYSLSIGVATEIDDATATVESTVAAVVTDEEGKIVLARLDAISYTAEVDVTTGAPKKVLPTSKYEQGENYGMDDYSNPPAIADWYLQAKAFESYVAGMSLTEVRAIALDEGKKPTDAELVAGCTIAVESFIVAIDKAMSSEHKVTFTTDKTGFTAAVSIAPSIDATEALAYEFGADFAAVVASGDTTLGAIIDSLAVTMNCVKDADNKLSAASKVYDGTKLEQGENYGMDDYSDPPAIGEWYEQALAYANEAKGKNPTALDSLPTEGVAGCTMYVGGYKTALAKAGKALR